MDNTHPRMPMTVNASGVSFGQAEPAFQLERLSTCITQGLSCVAASQETIRSQVEDIKRVAETLDPATGTVKKRQAAFADLQQQFADDSPDEHHQHLGKVMAVLNRLFVGGNAADFPQDNPPWEEVPSEQRDSVMAAPDPDRPDNWSRACRIG